ncbi:MAG: hypothetical protein ACRDSG_19650, partial [Pseudonocardiaceae bacterium]
MTAASAAERVGAHERIAARHPVHVGTDGDFALDDLLALPDVGRARRITAAQAIRAAPWRLNTASRELDTTSQHSAVAKPNASTEDDADLLHRIETSGLFRPPVHDEVAPLTPQLGATWLALAARWIDLSRSCGDLRFLNVACKLTGAVWLHHSRSDSDIAWQEPSLTGQLAALGRMLDETTEQLQRRLAARVLLAETARAGDDALHTARLATTAKARIVVLARSGSHSAGRLVTAATTAGLPIEAVCWYSPSKAQPSVSSNYSSAWYP